MSEEKNPKQPIEVFYSYVREDEKWRETLEKHLVMLKRAGVIRGWHRREILAGTEREGMIDEHLESAGVILLLVSPDFLASDCHYEIEVGRAMERHAEGTARVIPIILRHCDWSDALFGKLQALPRDGKPIADSRNIDEAFTNIVAELKRVIVELPQPPANKTETQTEVSRPTGRTQTPGGSQVSADRGGVALGDHASGNTINIYYSNPPSTPDEGSGSDK